MIVGLVLGRDPLQPVGPVHLCRLVKPLVDTGHGGQVDDGVPAHLLPDIDQADHDPESRGVIGHQVQLRIEHGIDRAAVVQKHFRNTGDDNPGYEVGKIGHRLREFLEPCKTQFVQDQRKKYRCDGSYGNAQDTDADGVDHGLAEEAVRKCLDKVIKAHEFPFPHRQGKGTRLYLLKGHRPSP